MTNGIGNKRGPKFDAACLAEYSTRVYICLSEHPSSIYTCATDSRGYARTCRESRAEPERNRENPRTDRCESQRGGAAPCFAPRRAKRMNILRVYRSRIRLSSGMIHGALSPPPSTIRSRQNTCSNRVLARDIQFEHVNSRRYNSSFMKVITIEIFAIERHWNDNLNVLDSLDVNHRVFVIIT